ncbi:hypothetical protein [Macrococcus capreoli]|nr:hypothetical protein [Macrococcus sp. TMW 2.2395]MCU7558527.1 hypothetical protein [Macrococcus sp. TMW 2.2395]
MKFKDIFKKREKECCEIKIINLDEKKDGNKNDSDKKEINKKNNINK